MPKYLNASGNVVPHNEPERLMWYGAGCSYWTDDWNKLGSSRMDHINPKSSGIPCCPVCGSVGFQINYDDWFTPPNSAQLSSVHKLRLNALFGSTVWDWKGYFEFLLSMKEHCFAPPHVEVYKAFAFYRENNKTLPPIRNPNA